jgi:hypothetical protein
LELGETCCTPSSFAIGLLDKYMNEVHYASCGLFRAEEVSVYMSMIGETRNVPEPIEYSIQQIWYPCIELLF